MDVFDSFARPARSKLLKASQLIVRLCTSKHSKSIQHAHGYARKLGRVSMNLTERFLWPNSRFLAKSLAVQNAGVLRNPRKVANRLTFLAKRYEKQRFLKTLVDNRMTSANQRINMNQPSSPTNRIDQSLVNHLVSNPLVQLVQSNQTSNKQKQTIHQHKVFLF